MRPGINPVTGSSSYVRPKERMPDAPCYVQGAPTIRDEMLGLGRLMLCGSRSVVRQASLFLVLSGLLKEVLVRVAGVTRHLPDKLRARGQTVARVTRLDQVVVQAEAVLRPPAR